MANTNPRFDAFLIANAGVNWSSNRARNAAFMTFISDMKRRFTGAMHEYDAQAHILDQNAFTRFIQQHVSNIHQST